MVIGMIIAMGVIGRHHRVIRHSCMMVHRAKRLRPGDLEHPQGDRKHNSDDFGHQPQRTNPYLIEVKLLSYRP
jgi:hypothetical protein